MFRASRSSAVSRPKWGSRIVQISRSYRETLHGQLKKRLELSENDASIAKRLLQEIEQRLSYLCDVGLGYLTLDRASKTLSGGESQRIALSACLGSSLVGSTYILDEPSIGLHPEDTARLISILEKLRDLGNTVVVVEHDEDIMKAADHLIDMGQKPEHMAVELFLRETIRSCIS